MFSIGFFVRLPDERPKLLVVLVVCAPSFNWRIQQRQENKAGCSTAAEAEAASKKVQLAPAADVSRRATKEEEEEESNDARQ